MREAGLRFGYHNHAFEFGEVDLWSRIVASGLDLELDVGWLRVAGRDPVAELEAHAGRLLLVHAKDVRPEGDGWLDVVAGDGELDFKAIAAAPRGGRREPPRRRARHAVRRPRRRRRAARSPRSSEAIA